MDFIRDADLVIMDSQYTAHEYPDKVGWGHATPDYAVDMAISAGIGTLVLHHHEPTRIDSAMAVVEQLAQKRAQNEAPNLEVIAAAEGLTLELEDLVSAGPAPTERQLPAFHPRLRIAVVGTDHEFMNVAWKALAQDHYDVLAVNDLEALQQGKFADYEPHLVLLEQGLTGWQAGSNAHFFDRVDRHEVPVIVIVTDGKIETAQEAFDQGASDVMLQPFASTQLRSRVDSWLLRSGIAVDRRIRGKHAAPLPQDRRIELPV
jgi:CheY-like chemotaxis protein